MLATRKTRLFELARNGNIVHKMAKYISNNLHIFITATQFGSTMSSIAIGWISQDLFSSFYLRTFGQYFKAVPFLKNSLLTTVLPFTIITFSIMTIGELLPKKITMLNPEKFALIFALPLYGFSKVFDPVIKFFNNITDNILKIFGKKSTSKEPPFSENELKIIINKSVKDGVIPVSLKLVIYNTLKMKKIKCQNIMVRLSRMKVFYSDDSLGKIQQKISRENLKFNRFPVIYRRTSKMVGFMETTELYRSISRYSAATVLAKTTLIKQPIKIHHEATADKVFSEMLKRKTHIAFINGGKNKPAGIITIGDIEKQLTRNN